MTYAHDSAKAKSECKHLSGAWTRKGAFSVMDCSCGEYQVIIDVDSTEAFSLFEGSDGAVQRFGNPLRTLTDGDAEVLDSWKERLEKAGVQT